MTQTAFAIDLRDSLESYYGPGQWTQRTAIATGSDIAPAVNASLTTIRNTFGRGKIIIPPGDWLISSQITPGLLSGNYIEGAGSMASRIYYNSPSGVAFQFNGAGGYSGGGVKGIALLLESGLGQTNAYGILLSGDAQHQPDQMSFDDIYMTAVGGASYWWEGFHADGTARTSPQGIRGLHVQNLQVFNCRNLAIWLSGVVQMYGANIGTYTGIGNGNDLYIKGINTTTGSTTQASLIRLTVGGQLHLQNASRIMLDGSSASFATDASATYVWGWLNSPTTIGAIGAGSNLTVRA